MTAPGVVVIERTTHVTPFGLGLWDGVTNALVSDGIDVRVWTPSARGPHSPKTARANRADIFVAQDFQALRAFESGAGDAAFWATLPTPPTSFLVDVRDTRGRFTSFATTIDMPAPRGTVVPTCIDTLFVPPNAPTSPIVRPAFVPIYSTAGRNAPAGMTAVRTRLMRDDGSGPAQFAVLEVREAGRLIGRGVADARGEVAAIFAYPEPPDAPATSPPSSPLSPLSPLSPSSSGPKQPLATQEWDVDVSVFYGSTLRMVRNDPSRPALPDLCALVSQPRATITSPAVALSPAKLRYGAELVLGDDRIATLFIHPG